MEGLRRLASDLGRHDDPKHEVYLRIFINTAADGLPPPPNLPPTTDRLAMRCVPCCVPWRCVGSCCCVDRWMRDRVRAGTAAWKEKALALGVVPELLKLLHPSFPDVKRMLAVWALSNLASEHCTPPPCACTTRHAQRMTHDSNLAMSRSQRWRRRRYARPQA
jgi:hypothetical protein